MAGSTNMGGHPLTLSKGHKYAASERPSTISVCVVHRSKMALLSPQPSELHIIVL